MRVNEKARSIIREKAIELFGAGTKVYLFGSRTDDTKKGGDIDLFIEPASQEDLIDKKIALLTRLKLALGDQHIDIVLAQNPARGIEQAARSQGIAL